MSIDKQHIYYNAFFGALISWPLIGLLLNFDTSRLLMLFLKDALLGAMEGVCIGAVDALILSRAWRRLGRGGLLDSLIQGQVTAEGKKTIKFKGGKTVKLG